MGNVTSCKVYFKGGSKIINGVDLRLVHEKKSVKIYQGDRLVAYFNTDNILGIVNVATEGSEE